MSNYNTLLTHFYPRPPRGGRLSGSTCCRFHRYNFYPRPPRGGRRPCLSESRPATMDFYPRPPRGGRPNKKERMVVQESISIHALREEGDLCPARPRAGRTNISIHALREEGDQYWRYYYSADDYFYPRPPRGGRLKLVTGAASAYSISIHALREEGDTTSSWWGASRRYFYPRPPRGGRRVKTARELDKMDFYPRPPRGGRLLRHSEEMDNAAFLSTPSARRATWGEGASCQLGEHFYPRPPRGGRRVDLGAAIDRIHISIHALREEGDRDFGVSESDYIQFLSTPSARRATRFCFLVSVPDRLFLSTPSARRATKDFRNFFRICVISIHALREEGDKTGTRSIMMQLYFYPRPPRGGRLLLCVNARYYKSISIHALREEGDALSSPSRYPHQYFYPRPPRGGRPTASGTVQGRKQFLSTPSARRATEPIPAPQPDIRHFYPRPPRGGRLSSSRSSRLKSNFYPRPPRGGRPVVLYNELHAVIFLSTPSARRATSCCLTGSLTDLPFLSTPSARRATWVRVLWTMLRRDFYPRPPRGGRPFPYAVICGENTFLSTPSARRATAELRR